MTPASSPSGLTQPELIFLVGPRGSGKSTVARLLADRLGWSWVDADDLIEAQAGTSIREIFAREGEAGFRDRESAVLAELGQRRRHVVATGGGVVLRPANRDLLARSGWVAWLDADADTLWSRLNADAATPGRRPDLLGGGRAEVEQILRQREPLYRECADCTVWTVGRSPAEVAAAVWDAWAGGGAS